MEAKSKPFEIPKKLFVQAFKLVKANKGSSGIDCETIIEFERNLKNNLYKLWNRMSSGSYFPPAVKAVAIPKKSGGERLLGIPTVSDRIAQMVVKLVFEPEVEKHFLPDSYGYRSGKSALDAIAITRERCWKYNWILEFDIKGLFDNICHELLMKAVKKHTDNQWVILYIERWLQSEIQMPNGDVVRRIRGTPQGGVISPILSNLFMHYAFDAWITKHHREKPWCRYADDGLVHCKTKEEALELLEELHERFGECGLELHPGKTRIVYCKDGKRTEEREASSFDFLGYTFRPRRVKNHRTGKLFVGFTPAVSHSATKDIRKQVRSMGIRNRSDLALKEIADWLNPKIRGWINYYGKFCPSLMRNVYRHLNGTIIAWAMAKYEVLRGKKSRARAWMEKVATKNQGLFAHWSLGNGRFA